MADETDAGMTVPATVDADVAGREVVATGGYLPSGSLLISEDLNLFFPQLQLLLEYTAPPAAVCCCVFPTHCADVKCFHITPANILAAQLGAADRSLVRG